LAPFGIPVGLPALAVLLIGWAIYRQRRLGYVFPQLTPALQRSIVAALVLVVIVLVIGICSPKALHRAKMRAVKGQSKKLGMAMIMYTSDLGEYYPWSGRDCPSSDVYWYELLSPYTEGAEVFFAPGTDGRKGKKYVTGVAGVGRKRTDGGVDWDRSDKSAREWRLHSKGRTWHRTQKKRPPSPPTARADGPVAQAKREYAYDAQTALAEKPGESGEDEAQTWATPEQRRIEAEATRQNRGQAKQLLQLGEALARKGDYGGAEENLKKALALNDKLSGARKALDRLHRVQALTGQKAAAGKPVDGPAPQGQPERPVPGGVAESEASKETSLGALRLRTERYVKAERKREAEPRAKRPARPRPVTDREKVTLDAAETPPKDVADFLADFAGAKDEKQLAKELEARRRLSAARALVRRKQAKEEEAARARLARLEKAQRGADRRRLLEQARERRQRLAAVQVSAGTAALGRVHQGKALGALPLPIQFPVTGTVPYLFRAAFLGERQAEVKITCVRVAAALCLQGVMFMLLFAALSVLCAKRPLAGLILAAALAAIFLLLRRLGTEPIKPYVDVAMLAAAAAAVVAIVTTVRERRSVAGTPARGEKS